MLYLPCFFMWYVNFFLKLLFRFRKACILFHWLLLHLSFWCSSLGISEKNSFSFCSLLSRVSVESRLLSVQQSITTFVLAFSPFSSKFQSQLTLCQTIFCLLLFLTLVSTCYNILMFYLKWYSIIWRRYSVMKVPIVNHKVISLTLSLPHCICSYLDNTLGLMS